jgi:hypothetical protein
MKGVFGGFNRAVLWLALELACGALLLGIALLLIPIQRVPVVASAFAALARSAGVDHPRAPMQISADDARCALSLRGDLGDELYPRTRLMLEAHPRTRAVLLNSAGGSALSITQVAELLHDRGVDTAVMYGQCDSACAFLWVSRPQRIIASATGTGAPGFHAPHVTLPWIGRIRALAQDQEQRDYLAAAGLPPAFIGWAYVPLDSLWRPDARTLSSIGVGAKYVRTRFPEKLSFCT